MARKAIFFNGLNELRAIAAFAVVFHHIESYKHRSDRASLFDTPLQSFIENLGYNAVWLFFVLSGFLITYLLLAEHKDTGRISIRDFYIRRTLRIWPLYFLIVALAFFAMPILAHQLPQLADEQYVQQCVESLDGNWWVRLFLFLFFLPNLALILYGPLAGATQTWSIGSEEQFYLVWPLIVRFFRRRLPLTLLMVILLKMLLLVLAFGVGARYEIPALEVLGKFLLTLRLELMAIGALGAYGLLHYRSYLADRLSSRPWKLVMLSLVAALLIWQFSISYLILGIGFAYVTMSVTVDGGIPLQNPWLDRLGRISYGIYMYHPMVIFLVCGTVHWLGIDDPLLYNVIIYTVVVSATVLVSSLSYRFFEAAFLRMKKRFSTILSGDSVKP